MIGQFESPSIVPALLGLFRNVIQAWNHPLLLPTIFLEHHMYRTRASTNYGNVIDETVRIERELRVTKVGQNTHSISDGKGKDLRAKTEELTVLINTHSTRIPFTSRSPDWNLKCSEFTLKLLSQLQPYLPEHHKMHHELEGLLEFNLGLAEVAVDDIASVRERMALQLSVLQCAPWRELLGLPPYSLPPWPPWSSAGVDGVAKLLPHTYTNRIRSRLARCAKLNLTAAIRTRGARTIVLLEEVNNILYVYYLIYRYFIKTTPRCKAWR